MNLDVLAGFFTKLGFPVAVAAWLLYRVDSLMVSWIAAQVQLADTQARVAVLLDQLIAMHK